MYIEILGREGSSEWKSYFVDSLSMLNTYILRNILKCMIVIFLSPQNGT